MKFCVMIDYNHLIDFAYVNNYRQRHGANIGRNDWQI